MSEAIKKLSTNSKHFFDVSLRGEWHYIKIRTDFAKDLAKIYSRCQIGDRFAFSNEFSWRSFLRFVSRGEIERLWNEKIKKDNDNEKNI